MAKPHVEEKKKEKKKFKTLKSPPWVKNPIRIKIPKRK